MNLEIQSKPTALLFLNDWRVDPEGANCGGGEIATISLAEALVGEGFKVVCCGNLTVPEGNYRGVDYWSFGESYDLAALMPRIEKLGKFYCFAATLVHPFLFLRSNENCLARILINHSPGVVSSGLEPRTVAHMVDYHVCVSEAQKKLILMRGDVPDDNMVVVPNGFDPKQFNYVGPEKRDFKKLLFAGRLEAPKGIHHLLGAYIELKKEFSDLKLDIFGSQDHWADLNNELARLQSQNPDLKYHGKVTRAELARHMQNAGIVVFPSLSFETAGLVVLEAQGCGCPVVANNIGGVPEYIKPGCGVLTRQADVHELTNTLRNLLRNQEQLKQMSRNCQVFEQKYSWACTAKQLINLADQVASRSKAVLENNIPELVLKLQPLKRSWDYNNFGYQQLLDDHEVIAHGNLVSDQQIIKFLQIPEILPAACLWQGLRLEHSGQKQEARESYVTALMLDNNKNWQSLFRLIMLDAETGNLSELETYTNKLINEHPNFPFRESLQKLLQTAKQTKTLRE